jgi:hypothetical protein
MYPSPTAQGLRGGWGAAWTSWATRRVPWATRRVAAACRSGSSYMGRDRVRDHVHGQGPSQRPREDSEKPAVHVRPGPRSEMPQSTRAPQSNLKM